MRGRNGGCNNVHQIPLRRIRRSYLMIGFLILHHAKINCFSLLLYVSCCLTGGIWSAAVSKAHRVTLLPGRSISFLHCVKIKGWKDSSVEYSVLQVLNVNTFKCLFKRVKNTKSNVCVMNCAVSPLCLSLPSFSPLCLPPLLSSFCPAEGQKHHQTSLSSAETTPHVEENSLAFTSQQQIFSSSLFSPVPP